MGEMTGAWRDFKNIFSRPQFTIIFLSRTDVLKFHPYSILTGQTMVRFVIYCVLKFIFFKMATKIDQIFTVNLTFTIVSVKSTVKIFSILVAFLENMNFKNMSAEIAAKNILCKFVVCGRTTA